MRSAYTAAITPRVCTSVLFIIIVVISSFSQQEINFRIQQAKSLTTEIKCFCVYSHSMYTASLCLLNCIIIFSCRVPFKRNSMSLYSPLSMLLWNLLCGPGAHEIRLKIGKKPFETPYIVTCIYIIFHLP